MHKVITDTAISTEISNTFNDTTRFYSQIVPINNIRASKFQNHQDCVKQLITRSVDRFLNIKTI